MSLIECSECGKQVSEKAKACIHCGNPMGEELPPSPTSSEPQRVITTEDSVLTRSRGCGDILIYGLLAVVMIPVLLMLCAGR